MPSEIELPAVKAGYAMLVYHANGGICTEKNTEAGILFDQSDVTDYLLPNCRGDLGTFVRPGYHLVEYNTMPDGSGQGYSLGSKIIVNTGVTKKDHEILYCIWLKETDASLFTYEFTEDGVTITDYHGEEQTLVIPAYIDGKPVTVIEKDACRGGTFTTLSLPKTLVRVAARAFANCSNLQTVYFPDSISTRSTRSS